MLIIIIAMIAFLITFSITEIRPEWRYYDQWKKRPLTRFRKAMTGNWAAAILGLFLIGTLSFLVVLLMSLLFIAIGKPQPHWDVVYNKPIYALQDSMSDYLWRHSADDEVVFSYLTEDNLGMIARTVNAKHVHISETEGQPTIRKYIVYFESDFLNWIFFPLYDCEYIFSVPPNSIITDYTVDLKGS